MILHVLPLLHCYDSRMIFLLLLCSVKMLNLGVWVDSLLSKVVLVFPATYHASSGTFNYFGIAPK